MPEEIWEVPFTESPLRINLAKCSETGHIATNRDDSFQVSMVPLESVLRSSTLPPTLSPVMGMRPNFHGLVRDCQAIPGLAQVNGRPPF